VLCQCPRGDQVVTEGVIRCPSHANAVKTWHQSAPERFNLAGGLQFPDDAVLSEVNALADGVKVNRD